MSYRNRVQELIYCLPSELADHPLQYKTHPDRQKQVMQGILEDVGISGVLLAYHSDRTGGLVSIDGHLRKSLDPNTPWPVVVLDLTDDEADKVLATYDTVTGLAEIDPELWATLQASVSFDNPNIQDMLASVVLGDPPMIEPGNGGDEFEPDEDVPCRVQAGDLWLIGGVHRLLCGDCTDAAIVARLMGGERADAVVTDPPYGMRLNADFSGMQNHLRFAQEQGVKSGRRYDDVIGDHEDYNAEPLRTLMGNIKEQLWFGADYYASTLGDTMHSGSWIVWDKRLDESADKMFGSCFELIWSQQKHKRDILRHKWAGIFGIEHGAQRGRKHPNQKPVRLIEDILIRYVEDNGLVFDGYLGSGTTLIAAHRTGRCCYGTEISPAYCEVILQRAEAEGLTVKLLERS